MIRKGAWARLRSSGVQGVVGYWHDWLEGEPEPDEPNLDLPYPYTLTVGGPGDPLVVAEDDLEVIEP